MVARTSAKTRQNIKQCHGFELETLGRMKTRCGARCTQGLLTSGQAADDHKVDSVKPGMRSLALRRASPQKFIPTGD
jgi:hypothetical protein